MHQFRQPGLQAAFAHRERRFDDREAVQQASDGVQVRAQGRGFADERPRQYTRGALPELRVVGGQRGRDGVEKAGEYEGAVDAQALEGRGVRK